MNKRKTLLLCGLLSSTFVGIPANFMRVILNDGTHTDYLVKDIDEVVFIDDTIPDPSDNYEYVDLGLSVLWATCNVGATEDYDPGWTLSWAETETKDSFDIMFHKYIKMDVEKEVYTGTDRQHYKYTKYVTNSKYGELDNLSVLQSEDDAATVNCGKYWRTPSMNELNELRGKCTWTFTEDYKGGHVGYIVTSNVPGFTDKSIFIPSAMTCNSQGCSNYLGNSGYYWSNELHANGASCWSLHFYGGKAPDTGSNDRSLGASVRGVREKSTVNLKYTVNFYDTDSTLLSTQSVKSGSAAKPVSIKDKEGYQFLGWSENIDNVDRNIDVYPLMYKASGEIGSYEYVDLGLSVLWASTNIGAEKIGDNGDFFAWGETTATKTGSTSDYSYPRKEGTNYGMNTQIEDNDTRLFPADDAASVQWGESWKTPTVEEMQELISKCNWKWLNSVNGSKVGGYVVTSKMKGYEDKFIFIPAAGRHSDSLLWDEGTNGAYWTSENNDTSMSAYAWLLYFNQGEYSIRYNFRSNGFSVRPVATK